VPRGVMGSTTAFGDAGSGGVMGRRVSEGPVSS
jgi:hypothetical protein